MQTHYYLFRAECEEDIMRLIAGIPANDFVSAKIYRNNLMPDADAMIVVTLNLEQMRKIIRTIPDSHVMLQTIQPNINYTGERDYDIT